LNRRAAAISSSGPDELHRVAVVFSQHSKTDFPDRPSGRVGVIPLQCSVNSVSGGIKSNPKGRQNKPIKTGQTGIHRVEIFRERVIAGKTRFMQLPMVRSKQLKGIRGS
jgi:hypothetical protein